MRIMRLLFGGGLLAVSFSAFAFVQEVQTGTGTPGRWTSFPVVYSFNARGLPELPATQEFDAVRAAFGTWDAVPTSGLTFAEAGSLVTNGVSISDSVNTVLWIDDPSHRLLQAFGLVAQTITWNCPDLTHTKFGWQACQQGVCRGEEATSLRSGVQG